MQDESERFVARSLMGCLAALGGTVAILGVVAVVISWLMRLL